MSSTKTATMSDLQKRIISPTLTVVGKTAEPNRILRHAPSIPPRFLSAPHLSMSRKKMMDNKVRSRYSHVNDQTNSDCIMPIPLHVSTDEFNLQHSATSQSFFSTTKVKHFTLPIGHFEEHSYRTSTPRAISRAVSMCGDRYMVKPIKYKNTATNGTIGPSSAKLCISSAISFASTMGRPMTSYANFNNNSHDNGGPKWRKSEQYLRFNDEQEALARCRILKRTTEVRPHRINRNYFMTGMSLRSENRYKTDPNRLKYMQGMAQAAKEGRLVFSDNGPVIAKNDDTKAEEEDEEIQKKGSIFITEQSIELQKENLEHNSGVFKATAVKKLEITPSDYCSSAETHTEETPVLFEPSAHEEEEKLDIPPTAVTSVPLSNINRIKEMYAKYHEALTDSHDEEDDSEDENDEEEDDQAENLTDDHLGTLRKTKDVKINFEKSFFKGQKYRFRDIDLMPDKRSQFREVTKHLVLKEENEILQVKPNLTPSQAQLFTRLFDSFDRDHDGRVTLKEIKKKVFNRNMRPSEILHFLQVFDLNKDKTIDVQEFLAVAALNDNLLQQTTIDPQVEWKVDLELLSYYITVYKEMFELCDITHDGRLSLEELMVIVAAGLDQETGTDVDLMQDVIASIDQNGNGYMEFVEYLTYIPLFIQIHQRLLHRPMLIEDVERSRRLVRIALNANAKMK